MITAILGVIAFLYLCELLQLLAGALVKIGSWFTH